MVAFAVWLVACGIVLCAAYLAVMAVVAVFLALGMGICGAMDRLWPPPIRRPQTPTERRRAALAQMFAEPPCTEPSSRV